MQSNSRFLRAAALGLALAVAAPVFAAEPSATEREEAKKSYADARKARADGKLAEALTLFRRAHELAPTAVTRLDLARALVDQSQLIAARDLARTIPAMPVTATETAKSKQSRQEAATLVTELDERIPRVTFEMDRQGEQEVAVDGITLSKELLTSAVEVEPGEHVVVVRLGAESVETRFSIAEREKKNVKLTSPAPPVEPPPAEPPPSDPTTPPAIPAEPPLDEKPAAENASLTPAVPILLSVGGGALLAGTISGAIALSQAGPLKAACDENECPVSQRDALATHQATTTASTALLAIGGIVAAAGGVVWIIDATTGGSSEGAKVGLHWLGTGVAFHASWL